MARPKGCKFSEEHKRNISISRKGKKNPKLSEALKKSAKAKIQQDRFRYKNPGLGSNQKGVNNHNFKGFTHYSSLHSSLSTWYGKTTKCEICGKSRDPSKLRDIDWANITGQYKIERSNWMPMCTKCHSRFDKWVVVICSGGLDSTTLLYWLKRQQKVHILALSFDYGQRHQKELEAIKETCARLNINHKVVDIKFVNSLMQGSALTSDIEVPSGNYEDESMKLTVVPNRNATFLSMAVAYAVSSGAGRVFIGVHSGDHHIYPDCRPEFIEKMNAVSRISNYLPVSIEAPFLNLTKSEIVKIGCMLNVDYSLTWTCYKGLNKPCGVCGACRERAEAFQVAGAKDPLDQIDY